ACADACPATLLPQQLLWYSKAKDNDKLQEYNLADCIECGACAYVCPSEIPLVQYYRVAKADIREQQREALKAEQAKARFEARNARLEAEKEARLARNKQLAAARVQA
ncbi:4Fe-4S dicluster domain-containing protein, partial [Weissella cibaria]|uniref:4Fe-4S dicluster domain-containing protein n=1 Tax=Weissella cibaria TaxID=137591 RepID=UPI00215A3155